MGKTAVRTLPIGQKDENALVIFSDLINLNGDYKDVSHKLTIFTLQTLNVLRTYFKTITISISDFQNL